MTKVKDCKNNVMKTGVLYGISHLNRPKYWLTHPSCLEAKQTNDNQYGFCDDNRGRSQQPWTAFKLFDKSWERNKEIDTETEYYIQHYEWNKENKEYEFYNYTWDAEKSKFSPSEKHYAKIKELGSFLSHLKTLVFQPSLEADQSDFKFKFLNTANFSYIKIKFQNGPGEKIETPNYNYLYAAETKETERLTSTASNIETVRYQSDKDIKDNMYEKTEMERMVLHPEVRDMAECFIFEPVSNYYISEIGRIGKNNGLLDFYRDDPEVKTIKGINQQETEQIIYTLRATAVKNENLAIADSSEEFFKIFVDGKITFGFPPTELPADLERKIPTLKGNNFVVTNESPIDIFKYEFPSNDILEPSHTEFKKNDFSNGKSALILYKLGNTLLAKTDGPVGERTIMTGSSTDKWQVFVDDRPKYSFTGIDNLIRIINDINTSIKFKGTSFHVTKNTNS